MYFFVSNIENNQLYQFIMVMHNRFRVNAITFQHAYGEKQRKNNEVMGPGSHATTIFLLCVHCARQLMSRTVVKLGSSVTTISFW